jgi:hypothetical protein
MFQHFLQRIPFSARKRNRERSTRKYLRLSLELLEIRDLPAPLTWFAAPMLPAARGGAVAAADQGSAFTFLGGGPSDVLTVNPADPAWAATSWSDPSFDGTTSVSPGVGILGSASLLVFGGSQGGGAVADAFQYYPATGAQAAASMHTPRAQLGFATDGNNLVYAIGGKNDNGMPLASMEYYTQSSNTWTLTASLPQTLYAESASYDGNGHIFTFGGVGADGTITSNVYEYTIATNTWAQAASMPVAVSNSAAVLASNGLIYVLGGTASTGATAATESYNSATNTWNTEASLPGPVSNEAVVSDSLGRIEILGGYDSSGNALANDWVSQRLNAPDSAPSFTSSPPTTGATGVAYSYQVFTTANPQATYVLTTAPIGMSIDPIKGLIQWTPTGSQTGNFSITVQASNYAGPTPQSFTISVAQSPPTTPTLTVTSVTDHSIGLSWNASYDPIGVSSYTVYHFYVTGIHGGIYHYDPVLTVSGTTTTGKVTGLASGTSYSYVVKAFDSSGLSSHYSNIAAATTSSTGTDVLIVAGFPSPSTAGVAGTFTVTALNPAGSTDTSYLGTVQFTSNDYQAALPANYTFTAADSGVHTFSATLKTASTRSITATDTVTSTITGTQSGITINPAAVSILSVYGFPSPVSAGVETTFGVSAQDAFGNYHPIPSYLGTVHFTSSDAAANLPADYTFVASDSGTHDFTATFNTAGYQSLTATDTMTPTLTATASGIYVNGAATDSLSVAGFPSPSTAGVAGTFTVTALNPGGGTDTSYQGTVYFTSSDAQAALPANYTFTAADNGVHSFSATLNTAGTQSITTTDTVTSTITGTQSGITINPAAVSSLSVYGFPSPVSAGVETTFGVSAQDAFGNYTSYLGTVHFTSSDAQAVLPADYTFTSTDAGVHSFTATLKTAGSQSITATDTVTSIITGTQAGISINPATAASFIVAGYPSPVTAGTSNSFTVTAKDPYGNRATGYAGTTHFTTSALKAVLPADYTFTSSDAGMHMFSATLRSAGTQSITATDTVTAFIAGTQSGILVNPAATDHLVVSRFPSKTTAGVAQGFRVTAQDRFANTTPAFADPVSFSSSDLKALLPAAYTFTSTDAGVHNFSATLVTAGSQSITVQDAMPNTTVAPGTESGILVNPAAASQLQVTGFPLSVLAGSSHTFTVTALDPYGNVATGYRGTVHFTSSDMQANLPADYPFTSGDAGIHTTFSATLNAVGNQSITATDTASGSITGMENGISAVSNQPTAGVSGPPSFSGSNGVPGQPLPFTFDATESGPTAGPQYTYSINWGDGSPIQTLPSPMNSSMATTTHAFPMPGSFTVSVTATDSNGNASLPASTSVSLTTIALEPDPSNSSQTALYVGGTTGNDNIVIGPAVMLVNGNPVYGVKVGMNLVGYGSFFSISHVIVYSQGGNDIIKTAAQTINGTLTYVTIPVMFFAGNGTDILNVSGSSVGNVLVGGGGTDRFLGGQGRDILIGGAGQATLQAGNPPSTNPAQGGAILIGGTTDYDTNVVALAAFLNEWTSSDDYATRIANLSASLHADMPGMPATVHDNHLADKLYGGTGMDWFFAGLLDVILNKTSGEVVTQI